MKRLLSILIIICLILTTSLIFVQPVNAVRSDHGYDDRTNDEDRDEATEDAATVIVNGDKIDSKDAPVIKYGKILIPVRPITRGLGAQLTWDDKTHTATVIKGAIKIVIKLEQKAIEVYNGTVKSTTNYDILSNPKNDKKAIVLIKFIAEILGKKVDVDGEVIIIEDGKIITVNDNVTGQGKNQFDYFGDWTYKNKVAGAYQRDIHWSSKKDAYFQVRFDGTQIKLYGTKASNFGVMAVSIDEGPEVMVDLYAKKHTENTLIYKSDILPNGQHKLKVRVTGTKNGKANGRYVAADRVEILGVTQPVQTGNLALGRPVETDSQQTDNTANKGNDGKLDTRWCAENSNRNHWWLVNLEGDYNLTGSEVTWEFDNKLYQYKIEVSSNKQDWVLKVDKTANAAKTKVQTDSFTASDVQYVRITVTGLESGAWASFSEFKVFGAPVSPEDNVAPTVPTGLAATAVSPAQIDLNWAGSTDNIGVAGYRIYRNDVHVASVTNRTNYSDVGLTPATTYTYKIVAYDNANNASGFSQTVQCTTQSIQSVNIALNRTASSDSVEAGHEASKGNDGNTETRWCAANGGLDHWWKVDLGSNYNITGSEVTWEKSDKFYQYKIEVSSDNTNWVSKVDKTGNTTRSLVQADSFAASEVRYVRITVTGLESGAWASFSEFKVFGTSGVVQVNDDVVGTGDNQFNYINSWSYGSQPGAYMNDNHWSNDTTAYFEVKFTGTQIKLYAAKAKNHGIATVLVDGVLQQNVDLYAASRVDNVLVYTSQILVPGQHTLKVSVTGSKNSSAGATYVAVDRVEIIK